ncbi:MAG: GNAT family N-acetyltransferase [Anaerolineaceae bacterium]|nr:MAG: GNAT family N-acetyltransferase [Anaerolineaceae bacterium]
MNADDDSATFRLMADVRVRSAVRDDLQKLEWYGQYTHYRNIIGRAYQEQKRGHRLLLVADFGGFPIGQLFVQYAAQNRRIADGATRAYLYAFRVFELFRGRGVGTYLLGCAEAILQDRGFRWATIAVARDNEGAFRLYRRLGYRIVAEDSGHWHYIDHQGITRHVHEPSWVMEKKL